MSEVLISCPKCNGQGKSRLSDSLVKAIGIIRGSKKPMTVAEYSVLMNVELTNAHHMMRRLKEVGLVEPWGESYPKKFRATRLRRVAKQCQIH